MRFSSAYARIWSGSIATRRVAAYSMSSIACLKALARYPAQQGADCLAATPTTAASLFKIAGNAGAGVAASVACGYLVVVGLAGERQYVINANFDRLKSTPLLSPPS